MCSVSLHRQTWEGVSQAQSQKPSQTLSPKPENMCNPLPFGRLNPLCKRLEMLEARVEAWKILGISKILELESLYNAEA